MSHSSSSFVSGELVGGLGNQMFILITAMATAIRHNLPYIFLKIGSSSSRFNSRSTYWSTLFRNVPTVAEFTQTVIDVHQPRFEYDPIVLPQTVAEIYLLKGYRQSYRFFEDEFPQVAQILDIETMREEVRLKTQPIDNTISVHFRLGDYVHLQHTHPLMPVAYYETAINRILGADSSVTNVAYFFEVADIAMVNHVYINYLTEKFPQLRFIRGSYDEIDDWEQVLAMSLCRHNVIGNSSFSWWSAYIGQTLDTDTGIKRIVCYPSLWFTNELRHRTYDMCPPNWTRIEVSLDM